jgi:aryl-alcohol dehydrogenase-like predicted oxidoreductase
MKALAVSERAGLTKYICQQVNYNLIARDVEHEIIPLGLDRIHRLTKSTSRTNSVFGM